METKRNVEGCIPHGPWGHSSGQPWDYLPKGIINKITVWHGRLVRSIEFQTDSSTCKVGDSKCKVIAGHRNDTFCIDYPSEYIVSISGTFGYYDGNYNRALKSICFKTNEHTYGPFGTNGDTAFSYDGKVDEVIVGFHGRVDDYLTAIGVYVMPKSLSFIQNATCEGKVTHELYSSMPGVVMPRDTDAGPWGVGRGKPWDDGVFSAIKQVRLHLGELNVIYAIQFEYLKTDGKSVMSQTHGGTDGTEIELVNLDVKDEYLIGISGYYGPVEAYAGLEAIVSITFHTNKRMYGPYGKERGAGYVHYSSTACPGKVVGFHGRSNGFLGAVGVHMEYF